MHQTLIIWKSRTLLLTNIHITNSAFKNPSHKSWYSKEHLILESSMSNSSRIQYHELWQQTKSRHFWIYTYIPQLFLGFFEYDQAAPNSWIGVCVFVSVCVCVRVHVCVRGREKDSAAKAHSRNEIQISKYHELYHLNIMSSDISISQTKSSQYHELCHVYIANSVIWIPQTLLF